MKGKAGVEACITPNWSAWRKCIRIVVECATPWVVGVLLTVQDCKMCACYVHG